MVRRPAIPGTQVLLIAAVVTALHAGAIPTASPISSDNPKYGAYMDVVNLLKRTIKPEVNPCDDFYQYTCGNFNSSMSMSFDVSDSDNFYKMAMQMEKDYYLAVSPLPVKQAAWYYQSCVDALSNWASVAGNGKLVIDSLNDVIQFGIPFPMLQQKSLDAMPTPTQLATLMGYIAGEYGVPTLLNPYVDTNWKDPHSENGYALFLDQPSTIYTNAYYRKAWNVTKDEFINDVMNNMAVVQQLYGKPVNPDRLRADAIDIVDFEYDLATEFSTDDKVRRQYARSYVPLNRLQAQGQFSFIDWRTFIAYAVSSAGDEVYMKVAHNPNYNYIFMEPAMLGKLQDALNSGRWSPSTVVNYIYYRIVENLSEFLPRSNQLESDSHAFKTYTVRPLVGKPRHIKIEERKFKRKHFSDRKSLQINCAADTMQNMQYANARVFIDNIYPNADDRVSVRHNVGKLIESILNAMRSMIDQLSWMSRSTKQGAYSKIDNLVKNIAFPDWIADDSKLSNFYSSLTIQQTDDYITMVKKLNFFNIQTSFLYLIKSTGSDRIDFNGPPGTTNAWYQPEVNSITFPAAILRQPFYDPNWPAAFNFGSMGVIAGHELTHGFDDEGVQWDGTGALNGWMDVQSNYHFEEMADCVVNEYSNFCPLPSNYSAAACIDGAQTQGENIADNGGIHSAFRAYKNYINLNGPDPRLPDDLLGQFTYDQLFFLGFAQVWCQMPPTFAHEFRQILVDVHSPSLYRVFGTIQNFPAFKTAFNCPFDSKYAPAKHCNVWVSDLDITTGIPEVKNDVNIPDPEKIEPRNMTVYNAYQQAVDFFTESIDFSKDPCNDFYKYACGKYNKPVSFHYADEKNKVAMATQLLDPKYAPTIQNSTALTKTLQLFTQCKTAAPTMNDDLKKKNLIKPKIAALQKMIGTSFPGFEHQSTPLNTMPTATQLAAALSLLSFEFGVDTLITPMVDTNWKKPTEGYFLHVDQNTAFWSKAYYQKGAWNITYPTYLTLCKNLMNNYAQSQGKSLNQNLLTRDLNDVFEFERVLAIQYSTDDTTRRQYSRSWNPTKISDLNGQYPFLDWPTFFSKVPGFTVTADYSVNILETAQFTALSTKLSAIVKPTVLVNYLNIRLLLAYRNLIPTYGSSHRIEKDWQGLGLRRRRRSHQVVVPQINTATLSGTDVSCAGATLDLLPFANGRVFVDYTYPTQEAKDTIKEAVGGVISNVLKAFQSMLDGLDWMDDTSKAGAYDKIRNIQKNVAYPDWIMDNGQLDAFYANLNITAGDDYYSILNALVSFNIYIQYNNLNKKSTDRSDFLGQPGIVNAWYQPELNSITFPAGILRAPYFDPNWPASLNYGGMGLVAGHELTHGFDDEGVQWNSLGALSSWMTPNSTTGFKEMAQCVINEYYSFCPLKDTTYYPQCLNGENTQGENIADNGGIHSAFRAYRTHIALNGPDPVLNHRVYGQLTHDQLFFMNFGQVWCEAEQSAASYFKQILVDPHSPANYRVFGTIQNFPAFRTAFNCPAGSVYGPTDHCHVWVPKQSP